MAAHNDLGKQAEEWAKDWLIGKGYVFSEANYRHGHAEIDLVFDFKGIKVFVEVKFRSGSAFGYAEEFVDATKRRLLVKAADHYVYEKGWLKDIRFDIVGVYKDKNGNVQFRHFEDAFY